MSKTTSHILAALFRHLKSHPTIDQVGVQPYRTLLEKSAAAFKPDKSVQAEPFMIDSMEARWLIPETNGDRRVILYVHGGGFIAGSIHSHQDLASRIAKACDAKALIFNYRLAPEHPFPEGLTDVRTAYEWLTRKYENTHDIVLVGDSAGAGLALSLLSTLLSDRYPLPVCSVLISPWINLDCDRLSRSENKDKDPMLSMDILKKTADLYTDKPLSHPLISPVRNDFTGITPVLIQAGENEILLDDSKLLAEKLRAAGAVADLEIWEDMFHVWHYFARYLSEARQAIQGIGTFVRRHARLPG
ncbi:MAG: alpha/beta hydrolase [Desulfobacula sp.]|nr:alpha/beta hydrolase [Desulfobacula sp.]